jgi:hypothetical protein
MGRTRRGRNRRRPKSNAVEIVQISVLIVALAFLLFFQGSLSSTVSLFMDSMGESEDIVAHQEPGGDSHGAAPGELPSK